MIKSFEENQISNGSHQVASETDKPEQETEIEAETDTPSKAKELITKYLDDSENKPEGASNGTEKSESEIVPEKVINELKEENTEEVRKSVRSSSPKILITRQTSTSSLEEAFIRRLQERHYKV